MKSFSTVLVGALLAAFSMVSCSKSNDALAPAKVNVGDNINGGVVIYVDASGQHGIVAATSDVTTSNNTLAWDVERVANNIYSPLTTGAQGTAIGTGAANTDKIIATVGTLYNAAGACRNYTGGGYADWYLPSKDELNLIVYVNKALFPNLLTGDYYWSSSESTYAAYPNSPSILLDAYAQNVGQASAFLPFKYQGGYVRPVRSF